MEPIIAIVLLVANIPVYKKILRIIFRDQEDVNDSIKYSFTPDLFSFFKGNYWKDKIGEAKITAFIFCCVSVVVIELLIIKWIIAIIV
ncbi:hypothetical protein [Ruminiclostridium cellulolyticum]|uniref:Uncharacterized protein n=1 Tax=Ruminiclostridium cellulolyticum (strain ATCC 35319 / DSM 5812 / JCM 6584 / H10) TaxID=394503 RepID=B8I722_RUMCH|nr:hypothetical protein [Ruminiclostridium cellulolyticum]ACL74946.1 hypothetical protein Ccel_0564 [Ruminiclostridium cellulolyticum H10]